MTTRTELEADLIEMQIEDLNTAKLALLEAIETITDVVPTTNRLGSEGNTLLMRLNSQLINFEQELTRVIARLNDEPAVVPPFPMV